MSNSKIEGSQQYPLGIYCECSHSWLNHHRLVIHTLWNTVEGMTHVLGMLLRQH